MKNNYFSIGEIASITGISRKTLIYYDNENIFKPAYVAKNKYRYYKRNQLETLSIISLLREYEMPLKEIKEFIANKGIDNFIDLSTDLEIKMEAKIKKATILLENIRYNKENIIRINNIKDLSIINIVSINETPLFTIELSAKEKLNHDYAPVFLKLEQTMKQHNTVGHGIYAQADKDMLNTSYKGELSSFSMGLNKSNSHLKNDSIKKGTYLHFFHKGTYDSIYKSYHRAFTYIKQNKYSISGPSYELDIINHFTNDLEDDYISEIWIKVDW